MMHKILFILFCFQLSFAQAKPILGHTKALIIGISHYQDPEIPDLQLPHRDAELFAALLRSNHSHLVDGENLLLLTNAQASAGKITAALDWLFEYIGSEDTVILYFAGYGLQLNQNAIPPSKLYFYDTPLNNTDAGSFDLFFQFQKLVQKKDPVFNVYGNIFPLLLSETQIDSTQTDKLKKQSKTFDHLVFLNTTNASTFAKTFADVSNFKISLNHFLLDGLMGFADINKDQSVSLKELGKYLKQQTDIQETWPGLIFVTGSSKHQYLTEVNPQLIKNLNSQNYPFEHSIIDPDLASNFNSFVDHLNEAQRLIYQDFKVAIKLGHLMTPAERNASMLCDSLLQMKELSSKYGEIRRNLSSALQDEVQQALNAYLNADSREISRRKSGNFQYNLYPKYLQRASELLGNNHYLNNILLAKRLYFEGLNRRLDGQQSKNQNLFRDALDLQLQAIAIEKEASFIYNEIAINYSLLNNKSEAIKNFMLALEYAPSWSIPFLNLAKIYVDDDLPKALRIAKHAARLSPRSAFAYSVVGDIYFKSIDFINAETAYLNALKYDPKYKTVLYNLACIKSLQSDFNAVEKYLDLALQNGFNDFELLNSDKDLNSFRQLNQWKTLVKKYFPEQFKDK